MRLIGNVHELALEWAWSNHNSGKVMGFNFRDLESQRIRF
jgi:hypothetical protein